MLKCLYSFPRHTEWERQLPICVQCWPERHRSGWSRRHVRQLPSGTQSWSGVWIHTHTHTHTHTFPFTSVPTVIHIHLTAFLYSSEYICLSVETESQWWALCSCLSFIMPFKSGVNPVCSWRAHQFNKAWWGARVLFKGPLMLASECEAPGWTLLRNGLALGYVHTQFTCAMLHWEIGMCCKTGIRKRMDVGGTSLNLIWCDLLRLLVKDLAASSSQVADCNQCGYLPHSSL